MKKDHSAQTKHSAQYENRKSSRMGEPLKRNFKRSFSKEQLEQMTFEEKTKLFVIDDPEQWLEFRRQLKEHGVTTNVCVQEHLAIFVQNIIADAVKETHNPDKQEFGQRKK
eukprot:CAMPEP_0172517202 /NCGR_PEP_ID=MMETSP1066-20121228/282910_1 /TAXON_ID=671091 /ORGANISM="Coscinodiscus wailesii, Strain CCMP2513" /LENGTH=110 /DNA_ID=CAMNT_0013299071 /DNA_START=11 /DNA_END=340 /DNA_ORIENTATION=+